MPESNLKFVWSVIIIILLLFTGIYVPLRIAFYDKVNFSLTIIEYCVDGLFIIDIIINCISAFYNDEHQLITNHYLILKNYMTGWLLIDLIAWYYIYNMIIFI